MAGETELIEEKNGGHKKSIGGSRKLLQLFRFKPRKWKIKQPENNDVEKKKSPDERRDQLDRDMRNNWDQLPATLRRRKEKLSQAVLDQFTEDVHSAEEEVKANKTADDVINLASLEELLPGKKITDVKNNTEQDAVSVDSLQVSDSSQIIVKPQIHRECNSSLEEDDSSQVIHSNTETDDKRNSSDMTDAENREQSEEKKSEPDLKPSTADEIVVQSESKEVDSTLELVAIPISDSTSENNSSQESAVGSSEKSIGSEKDGDKSENSSAKAVVSEASSTKSIENEPVSEKSHDKSILNKIAADDNANSKQQCSDNEFVSEKSRDNSIPNKIAADDNENSKQQCNENAFVSEKSRDNSIPNKVTADDNANSKQQCSEHAFISEKSRDNSISNKIAADDNSKQQCSENGFVSEKVEVLNRNSYENKLVSEISSNKFNGSGKSGDATENSSVTCVTNNTFLPNSENSKQETIVNKTDESETEVKTLFLLPNESQLYQSHLKGEDKSAHDESPTDSETTTYEDVVQEPSRSRSPLSHEEQQVMALLSRAVSEDSLLIPSSPSSSSTSSVASSNDERNNDSGTDVNSPTPSTVSSNIESVSTTVSRARDDSVPHYQNPKSPYRSVNKGVIHSTKNLVMPVPATSESSTDSGLEKSSNPSADSSSSSSVPTTKSSKTSKESDEFKSVPLYSSAKIQNSSSGASNCCFKSSTDDPVLYEVVIPRAEYHKPSSVALKNADYQRPKENSTEDRSNSRNVSKPTLPGKEEDDVMSYYDSVVRESSRPKSSDNDSEDLFPLSRRPVLDYKEFEFVSKGFYINDYVQLEMKSPTPSPGNAFAKRYAAMEFVNGFASPALSDPSKTFVIGGKWKKPYALETLNKKPLTMATIMEEREVEDSEGEKLSVREILRRFEELGGRVQLPGDGDSDAEKSATLREIQETLRCLEEKVRHYETKAATTQTQDSDESSSGDKLLQKAAPRIPDGLAPSKIALDSWTGHPRSQQQTPSHQLQSHNSSPLSQHQQHHLQRNVISSSPQPPEPPGRHDGKHSLLQFAMLHFRQSPEKFEMLKTADGSISGSLKVIESLKTNKKSKGKKGNKENDWTWKEQVDLVKFSSVPIEQSLLRLEPGELSELAVECFAAVMRYMGDLPMAPDSTEVKCVYTILMHCHKHEALRDEVYCQLMKQTTNNKSPKPDSCQRGWRLFSIVAAYFVCSDTLKPYLFKYLETAAYDKRRAYHGTATVCLQNLRKTFKYGGRKNVPSVEEITAISAGRNSKRQIYRLPGGTERVVNTKSTTVVQDVIEELCTVIGVTGGEMEMEEFSLYCIVEGDTFTMPLAREEYILDVTTELHKNQQVFYLIFCRSVWHFPLRLDSQLYVEVVFNQIAPDYLEGLLLVMPGEQLDQDVIYDIAKMAALLHRAADMTHVPTMKETKFLLPKPALTVRDVKPAQWVNMVQSNWRDVEMLTTIQSKAQVLDILSKWPLFGSSFFAVKRVSDPKERSDHILALNRHGVHFIDLVTHETLTHYTFSEVISTRKVKSEDGTLFLDMKCGNLMQQRITRLQTDQAHEISRLIRQYITMEQRLQQRSAA